MGSALETTTPSNPSKYFSYKQKNSAPPTGAELMREMDMLMGNTDSKKKSEMT
jgi:hypothetical protein